MSWRNLVVANPTALSRKNGQLLCRQEGEKILSIPLEDIASITLETPQATVTSALLGELSRLGIVLITCDSRHMPNGALLPLVSHSRPLAIIKRQMTWSLPFKKRLWQAIVRRKIENQDQVLADAGCETTELPALARRVSSGDAENREAQAARIYFSRLFTDFKRHADDKRNAALNYGYAIVRAALARELAQFGFHPALGIHHCNELNAFNLADDLLEPFRPLVDGWILASLDFSNEKTLSVEDRARITQALQMSCVIDGREQRLLHSTHLCVKSLSSATGGVDTGLLQLPEWSAPARLKPLE